VCSSDLPTNWVTGLPANGLTGSVVGTGIEDGLPYVDVRAQGTVSTNSAPSWRVEANNNIAATPAQSWTASAYVKLVAGSIPGLGEAVVQLRSVDSGGSTISTTTVGARVVTGASLASQRVTGSDATAALTAFVSMLVSVSTLSAGAVVDFTLRIAAPQLELGSRASSPILTFGAAATRAADALRSPLPALLIGLQECTVIVDYVRDRAAGASEYPGIFKIQESANTLKLIGGYVSPTTVSQSVLLVRDTTTQAEIGAIGSATEGALTRAGFAFEANNFAVDANVGAPNAYVSGSFPTNLNLLFLGNLDSSLNGHIGRIRYIGRRLSDGQLRALTE
jgi:hypothetical protein